MSFSLHSSTENLGGGRRSGSEGSNSSSKLSWPVKSSIGLMSPNASARPLSKNHWNESRWTEIRSGSGRASSIFAKETRSGLRDREGNGLLLPIRVLTGETGMQNASGARDRSENGGRDVDQGRRRGARDPARISGTDQGLRTATL